MKFIRVATSEDAALQIAGGGVPLAGGTVLVPEIASGGFSEATIVELGRIDTLQTLRLHDDYLHIGATATLASLITSTELKSEHAAVVRAAAMVGNPQVRRVATVGGNIAVALPESDLLPALLVLDAQVVQSGGGSEDSGPLDQVIKEGLSSGRLITAIKLRLDGGRRSGFHKFAWRRASGKTIVNVAVSLRIDGDLIVQPRIAAGGLCHRPARLPQAEQTLAGYALSEVLIEEVAHVAAAEVACDVTSPPNEEYRRRLVGAGLRIVLGDLLRG